MTPLRGNPHPLYPIHSPIAAPILYLALQGLTGPL